MFMSLFRLGRVISACLLITFSTTATANTLPERLIVKLKTDSLQAKSLAPTALLKTKTHSLDTYIVEAASPTELTYLEQQLKTSLHVESVERDVPIYPASTTPNDLRFVDQHYLQTPTEYNLSAINLPQAWDISQGSNDITIAVLDTGITQHGDLNANLIGGSVEKSGYDMINSSLVGNDGDLRDNNPTDTGDSDTNSTWHGTHVAGTIAAHTNNATGISGISWHSKILNVRILGKQGGYTSDLIDGIYWALGQSVSGTPLNTNPANIINLSLGGLGNCSASLQKAINTAHEAGVPVVVAAGNHRVDAKNFTPANCDNVIVVGALDQYGQASSISNYGESVDISAPGVNILSTSNSGVAKPYQPDYEHQSGTSMSTAQVSGVLALMLSANPALKQKDNLVELLQAKLQQSSRAFTGTSGTHCFTNQNCGAGMLDAYRALQAVTQAPTPIIKQTQTDNIVTLDASGSYDDIANQQLSYQWEQLTGTTVDINDTSAKQLTLTLPDSTQDYTFVLTVTDDLGFKQSKNVIVSASSEPRQPANADNTTTPTNSGNSGGGGGSLPFSLLALSGLLFFRRR